MPALDVLPSALVSAAAGVRAFGRDVDGVPPLALTSGSAVLDAAVAEVAREWGRVARSLEERAATAGRGLELTAQHYGGLERLLVPPALR